MFHIHTSISCWHRSLTIWTLIRDAWVCASQTTNVCSIYIIKRIFYFRICMRIHSLAAADEMCTKLRCTEMGPSVLRQIQFVLMVKCCSIDDAVLLPAALYVLTWAWASVVITLVGIANELIIIAQWDFMLAPAQQRMMIITPCALATTSMPYNVLCVAVLRMQNAFLTNCLLQSDNLRCEKLHHMRAWHSRECAHIPYGHTCSHIGKLCCVRRLAWHTSAWRYGWAAFSATLVCGGIMAPPSSF